MLKAYLAIFLIVSLARASISDGPFFCVTDDQSATCSADLTDNKESIGFQGKSQFAIYDNSCVACKDAKVKAAFDLSVCPDPAMKKPCINMNVPVCGIVDSKTLHQYKNECDACSDGKPKQYFHGFCPFTNDRPHQNENKTEKAAGAESKLNAAPAVGAKPKAAKNALKAPASVKTAPVAAPAAAPAASTAAPASSTQNTGTATAASKPAPAPAAATNASANSTVGAH